MSSNAELSSTEKSGTRSGAWRILILVPILILALAAGLVAQNGDRLINALGTNPPSPDAFNVSRVDFVDEKYGEEEIRIHLTNPQSQDLTIAALMIDDAVVPYEVEGGSKTMSHLAQRTIVVPYQWVKEDPYLITMTSSSGIATEHTVAAALPRPGVTGKGIGAGAILGFLVGILPIALGIAWLPALRTARKEMLAAFMALTAGLLAFVALDAFAEALELQTKLPGAVGGLGILLVGIASSYLIMAWMQQRWQKRGAASTEGVATQKTGSVTMPLQLATLVAVGIGMHNLGEGLAIGSSFALGELPLATFLIIGFMVHNISEGLGIAVPASESKTRVSLVRLALLTLVSGGPTIFGIWIGRYITNDLIGVLFFSLAVGAATHVIVEVIRHMRGLNENRQLINGWTAAGFIAGVTIMYVTGLLV